MTFPTLVSARNAYILEQVSLGKYEIEWAPIVVTEKGHSATFLVSCDALKIEGVRVNVSAEMQQQIADTIGASLMTPKIADLRFANAQIRLPPMPMGITDSTAAMLSQSKKIDDAIAQRAGSDTKGKIVATTGKNWVLTNELIGAHPSNDAANYGWHFTATGPSWKGIKGYLCDSRMTDPLTKLQIFVIQSSAEAHNRKHLDYSQIAEYVYETCVVDGQQRALTDVLSDPALAFLGSHEGPLKILRQPNVPPPKERVIVLPEVTITLDGTE
jgi:hypothetical protein